MNLIYLVLLCGLIATSFVHTSEARLNVESIVGGTASTVTQNTYVVSIQSKHASQAIYWHLCGGGILNNRHIITAAHCFINSDNNIFENAEYIVVAGVTHAHNVHEPHRVTREVTKIYVPREYNPTMVRQVGNRRSGDIAVLELNSDLDRNEFITNVVLPANARLHSTYMGQQADVCGYGDDWVAVANNPRTNRIVEFCSGNHCYERKFARVNLIANLACRNFYNNIMHTQLCGNMVQRFPAHPEGLCRGDSGAPLVIDRTVIGVVSSSPTGCRENIKPAIYTRVTSFLTFITNAMSGIREPDMRLAKYEVIAHGGRGTEKVLLEQ